MVKLGTNLSDKLNKQPPMDDGFDNIPLITPLEVNQLQHAFGDKVIVRTSRQYQLQPQQKKKSRLFMSNIEKLNIHFYNEVSEKAKITGLILITLAFLTSLLLLLMYKAMWYDQLTCPDGFVLKRHCSPAALEMYYTEQQPVDHSSQTRLLTALNQVKKTGRELPSPWLPVISALKEAENGKQDSEPLQSMMDPDK